MEISFTYYYEKVIRERGNCYLITHIAIAVMFKPFYTAVDSAQHIDDDKF